MTTPITETELAQYFLEIAAAARKGELDALSSARDFLAKFDIAPKIHPLEEHRQRLRERFQRYRS